VDLLGHHGLILHSSGTGVGVLVNLGERYNDTVYSNDDPCSVMASQTHGMDPLFLLPFPLEEHATTKCSSKVVLRFTRGEKKERGGNIGVCYPLNSPLWMVTFVPDRCAFLYRSVDRGSLLEE
jgi:hypothetical protein